jgi:hypothetical protein
MDSSAESEEMRDLQLSNHKIDYTANVYAVAAIISITLNRCGCGYGA